MKRHSEGCTNEYNREKSMSKEVNLKDLRKGDYIQHKLGGDKYEVLGVTAWELRVKTPNQDYLDAGFSSLTGLDFVGYRSTPKVERGVIYKNPYTLPM